MTGGIESGKVNVLLNWKKTSTTGYWLNLFVRQRSIQTKVSITYQMKRKVGIKKVKKFLDIFFYSKDIYWLFTNNQWCLWKCRRVQSYKEKKNVIKLLNWSWNTENSTYHNPISKCLKINFLLWHILLWKYLAKDNFKK